MTAIRKIIENYSNPLTLDLPEEYENKKIEIIVLPLDDEKDNQDDLSNFFGKLKWKGDALEEQKKLRNEWD